MADNKKIKTYRLTIKYYSDTDEVIYISEGISENSSTIYEIDNFDMTDYFEPEWVEMIDGVNCGEA